MVAGMGSLNACAFCKRAKWKCDKVRPSCANCLRLRKTCLYMEDSLITDAGIHHQPRSNPQGLRDLEPYFASPSSGINVSSNDMLQKSTVDFVMRLFDSWENIIDISTAFFTGTHQRISAISRSRYMDDVAALQITPQADVAVLCLCILLIEQRPMNDTTDMLSPLYFQTKSLITLLETRNGPTLNIVQCRILVTFYEMGHGFQATAYRSIATCARSARALGLHRKRWRAPPPLSEKTRLEEEKRVWWAVIIMDRFINMCNADVLLATDDPETKDPLPIDDLVWSEASDRSDIEQSFDTSPLIDTSFHITVGQMARECQVSHLLGRVVQLVFDPTSDSKFNAESARQLEHTLKAYLPLLSNEELKIGKYCGAYGMSNSALFLIYQFMLDQSADKSTKASEVTQLMQEVSSGAITFAEASYGDRNENYPPEYRLWEFTADPSCKQRVDSLKKIIAEFTNRWKVAWHYLDVLEKLDQN